MTLKKTARRIQRHVRQANSNRHEKRSAKITLELPGSPSRVDEIAKLFLRQVNRPKVTHANTGNRRYWLFTPLLIARVTGGFKIMPVGRILVAPVINLSASEHMVATSLEMRRECDRIFQHRRQMVRLTQLIHAGGGRPHAGQKAHARRIANRRLAMGIAEQHTAPGKAIDIRRAHLRVSAEAADPVVQIVNRDEQHIGSLGRRLAKRH